MRVNVTHPTGRFVPGVQEVTEAEAQRLFAKGRAIRVPAPVVIEPDDVIQEPEVNE